LFTFPAVLDLAAFGRAVEASKVKISSGGSPQAALSAFESKGKRKLDRNDAEKHHPPGKEPCRPSFISYKGSSW